MHCRTCCKSTQMLSSREVVQYCLYAVQRGHQSNPTVQDIGLSSASLLFLFFPIYSTTAAYHSKNERKYGAVGAA